LCDSSTGSGSNVVVVVVVGVVVFVVFVVVEVADVVGVVGVDVDNMGVDVDVDVVVVVVVVVGVVDVVVVVVVVVSVVVVVFATSVVAVVVFTSAAAVVVAVVVALGDDAVVVVELASEPLETTGDTVAVHCRSSRSSAGLMRWSPPLPKTLPSCVRFARTLSVTERTTPTLLAPACVTVRTALHARHDGACTDTREALNVHCAHATTSLLLLSSCGCSSRSACSGVNTAGGTRRSAQLLSASQLAAVDLASAASSTTGAVRAAHDNINRAGAHCPSATPTEHGEREGAGAVHSGLL
jgi:hypothetical protein